jgi:hypothetical protein
MEVAFSPRPTEGKVRKLERFFELVPALLSAIVIVGMLALLLIQPVIAALITIAFVLSWLFRMVYSNMLLTWSFLRLRAERGTDWMERLRALEELSGGAAALGAEPAAPLKGHWLSRWIYLRDLRRLHAAKTLLPSAQDVYHVVIIPIAGESRSVFEPGVASIAASRYPASRILLILAVEQRASERVKSDAEEVGERYCGSFMGLIVAIHPDGISGEARVKGANATYGARAAAEFMRARAIPLENVLVSCFDADTVSTPQYFACLTYHFLICLDRNRASYQPVPVYLNNLWEAPAFARVLDMGSSFFQLMEAANPEKMVTFSSHSMSFAALVEVGYWPVDMVSDDSAIYWKAFLHFKGDYRVFPLPVTLSMDITQGETWWKTVTSVYKQKRRWAWGVESFPIVMAAFILTKGIPLSTRVKQGYRLLQTHLSWATWPFLLGVMSWLPAIFISLGNTHSVVRYSEPRILSTLYDLALFGFLLYALLSQLFVPREMGKGHLGKRIAHSLQWLLVPVVSLLFGAIPALDAQARLLLGKRLEFWVTGKQRKPQPKAAKDKGDGKLPTPSS